RLERPQQQDQRDRGHLAQEAGASAVPAVRAVACRDHRADHEIDDAGEQIEDEELEQDSVVQDRGKQSAQRRECLGPARRLVEALKWAQQVEPVHRIGLGIVVAHCDLRGERCKEPRHSSPGGGVPGLAGSPAARRGPRTVRLYAATTPYTAAALGARATSRYSYARS